MSESAPTWEEGGRIDGWRDFSDRVCAALAWACTQPTSLCLSDRDFQSWPLGQRAVVTALQSWAMANRQARMQVLLAQTDRVALQHPRWIAWRQGWGHRVQVWQADDDQRDQVPTLLLVGKVLGLRLHDPQRGQGVWTRDAATVQHWQDGFDVILQRSVSALPVTTLGL
ncbi:hypothetical protein WNB94_13260 [Aquabacterium sp. A3]|uniref:DUF7931 domain-containing protein n=1 Tax=Aquabacterium sp. A3 TaxID=3132829 RepID=UPI00311A4BA9